MWAGVITPWALIRALGLLDTGKLGLAIAIALSGNIMQLQKKGVPHAT